MAVKPVDEVVQTDAIEKTMELRAPVSRVWRALTDSQQFSQWFCVNFEAPFVAGKKMLGKITYPRYEHLTMEITVKAIEPETYFAYTWHPYAIDPSVDYSHETPTLVEFRLEATTGGTLLSIKESGFDSVPEERRFEAFRRNDGGWDEQIENIVRYLAKQG